MSRKTKHAPVDVHLGSPVLPAAIRRIRTDESGRLTAFVDPGDHDLSLLRSIAEAIRADEETVELLVQYAELCNNRDEYVRNGRTATAGWHALNDDATDVAAQIDARLEWGNLGDLVVAALLPEDTTELAEALRPLARPAVRVVEEVGA